MSEEISKVPNGANLDKKEIELAAKAITDGELVVFPTETVYGIGANALDGEAVRKIFAAKQRPADNPLIVHISSPASLAKLTNRANQILEGSETEYNIEQQLIEKFWPGPLTIVFPKSGAVPSETTGGLETVAVRMPDHPVALQLIEEAGTPIAAPSANISGRPSPTDYDQLDLELLKSVKVAIDGGSAKFGLESTVVKVEQGNIKLLRPGAVTIEQLTEIAPVEDLSEPKFQQQKLLDPAEESSDFKPASPGMKYRHYAPDAKLILFEYDDDYNFLTEMQEYLRLNSHKATGVICANEFSLQFPEADRVIDFGHLKSPPTIASSLFSILNSLDAFNLEEFIIHGIPEQGIGKAVMNRLRKAAD